MQTANSNSVIGAVATLQIFIGQFRYPELHKPAVPLWRQGKPHQAGPGRGLSVPRSVDLLFPANNQVKNIYLFLDVN